jgi:hypothetical protein
LKHVDQRATLHWSPAKTGGFSDVVRDRVVMTIFAFGNIFFGHLEEKTPKWLPKQGVNGWTGEPKEKYYQLRGWDL